MLRTTLISVACALCLPVAADQRCDTSQYPLSAPSDRFVDNGDGTITDRATLLMWMRCSQGQRWSSGTCEGSASRHDWLGASAAAEELNNAGESFFNDWRLPSLTEIAAIVERQCGEPRINLDVFPDTPPGVFWSSSARPKDAETVYALGFGDQGVAPVAKGEAHHVRLVRTGP